ncbi:hypothetical protein C8J98_10535 [Luteibacter sp. OK325]|uniref:phospholipase D family protein n=1 Tax=Luteibacter sp. OK325 TaxID=2135670 RepID=UPI000D356431|nr:phospholipase D family protein [Luteibacter sp. OK325]PTR32482.1 hypothetical protein C8J98_10535 [Luteibacter sp. OK325]
MTVLTNAAAIRKAILAVRPTRVAVAYVGSDWATFFPEGLPKEIVLSPTFGSNPYAIEEIIDALGERNVHFLDRLHAKIFLGAEAAVVGSCNLTRNGLADRGLFEVAAAISDVADMKALADAFAVYRAAARNLYPNRASKLTKIHALKESWVRGIVAGIVPPHMQVPAPDARDHILDMPTVRISWYHGGANPGFNNSRIRDAAPDIGGEAGIDDFMYFKDTDDVKQGDWHLAIRYKADGFPPANGAISWVYTHHLIKDAVFDEAWPDDTSLAVQGKLPRPIPPFKLDSDTRSAIRELVSESRFADFRPPTDPDGDWHLPSRARVATFLQALQRLRQLQGSM